MPDLGKPEPYIQGSFAAGEISPGLWARVDMDKYHIGAQLLRNFVVDYRGGAFNRAGTEFCGQSLNTDMDGTRLIPFRFNSTQQYILVFTPDHIRVIYDGAYVTEATTAITGITKTSPGVVTDAAHGYSDDDQVFLSDIGGMTELNGRTVSIDVLTVDTFAIYDLDGDAIDTTGFTTYTSGGTAARLVDIDSPYDEDEVNLLNYVQNADIMLLYSAERSIYKLSRLSHSSWTLDEIEWFVPTQDYPTALASSSTLGAGTTDYLYGVSAVGENGEESFANVIHITNLDFMNANDESISISWSPPASGAAPQLYYIYRAPFAKNKAITASPMLYFIGQTRGGNFHDNNIEADKTKTAIWPPNNGGAFPPYLDQYGYPLGFPTVGAFFQQRLYSADSDTYPTTFWTSRVGFYLNNSKTNPARDDDALVASVLTYEVNPIWHLVSMPGELLMFNASGVFGVSGGGLNTPVTPGNIMVNQHAYVGSVQQPGPIVVDYDILYVQGKGNSVRDMIYNLGADIFTSTDISILSAHLLQNYTIDEWCYCQDPHKLVWSVRSDGKLLSLTYVREQEVFAWSHHDTYGQFRSCASIIEHGQDTPYFVVRRRQADGVDRNYIERMKNRVIRTNDDCWFLDSALSTTGTFPAARLIINQQTGHCFATPGVFSSGDVGSFIRANSGVAEITAFTDSSNLTVRIIEAFPDPVDEPDNTEYLPTFLDDEWSLWAPVSTVTGLAHLEGLTVGIVADGSPRSLQEVVDGSITLDPPATKVIAGLQYLPQLQTLRLDLGQPVVASRRKKLQALTLRVEKSRGFSVGSDFSYMTQVKESPPELGVPTELTTGDALRTLLDSTWDLTGQICVQQDYPLPITVLGVIPEAAIGDN